MTDIERTSLREQWPKGILGSLQYFTDHILFRFKRPVDWSAVDAVENGLMHGRLVFDGGVFVLTHEEAEVFHFLGRHQSLERVRADIGMSVERIDHCLARIIHKSGVQDDAELIQLAKRHKR